MRATRHSRNGSAYWRHGCGNRLRPDWLEICAHAAALVEPLACVLRRIHEMEVRTGDTAVVIGCGPIGLKFVRMLPRSLSRWHACYAAFTKWKCVLATRLW